MAIKLDMSSLKFEGIELQEIAAAVRVRMAHAPQDLRVEVFKAGDEYEGVANYRYWGPEQAGPYKSLRAKATVEQAIADAILGIKNFAKAEYPAEVVFWENDNGQYVDGNGQAVEYKDALARRDKYKAGKHS